ncbi:MAG: hypothetical protein EOL86_01495 [Deltaproteobacteria bacterium]|nr:hypothetical protein [Deltaproteobacteria bacterium]
MYQTRAALQAKEDIWVSAPSSKGGVDELAAKKNRVAEERLSYFFWRDRENVLSVELFQMVGTTVPFSSSQGG